MTHLLNTAENDVNVNPKRYTKEGISYKGFRCPDLPQADIAQFFDESVEFIDRALSFSCGKVFVNCLLVSLRTKLLPGNLIYITYVMVETPAGSQGLVDSISYLILTRA